MAPRCGARGKPVSPGPRARLRPAQPPPETQRGLGLPGRPEPGEVFPGVGWAQRCCWASYKAEESIRLRAEPQPRSPASPASPRFGLTLRAAPTTPTHPPTTQHPHRHSVQGKRGRSWEQGTALGIREPHHVPAGELKPSPLPAFPLLLAPKAFALLIVQAARPYLPPSRRQVPPSTPLLSSPSDGPASRSLPGALLPLQPFLGNPPLSPVDTHGVRTGGTLLAWFSRTPPRGGIGSVEQSAAPRTDLPAGTPTPWHQGKPSSLEEGLQAAGGGSQEAPPAAHRGWSAQAPAEVDCQNCHKTPGLSRTVFGSPGRPQVQL